MTDQLLTFDEAKSWRFCEKCGKELTHKHDYRFDHETGERYVYGEFDICPDWDGPSFTGGHTRIELIAGRAGEDGVVEEVPA